LKDFKCDFFNKSTQNSPLSFVYRNFTQMPSVSRKYFENISKYCTAHQKAPIPF